MSLLTEAFRRWPAASLREFLLRPILPPCPADCTIANSDETMRFSSCQAGDDRTSLVDDAARARGHAGCRARRCTSLAPLPAKHWSVQHSACGARITLSSLRIGSFGVRRLDLQHVQPGAGDATLLQHLGQRLLIDDRPAGGVDEERRRLHQRQALGIHQVLRRLGISGQLTVRKSARRNTSSRLDELDSQHFATSGLA